ncbi:MAG: dicarboxylate/amino acid:cation symporter, partial [Nannocystaceae bacterium]
MRKLPLHLWILIALVLGVAYGYISAVLGASGHVLTFVKPIGDLFLNLLRMIAVPLVLFSLVAGVASLRDASKLARIGGKTVALYLLTTAVAITLGLVVVNALEPGAGLSPELRDQLRTSVLAGTSSDTVDRRIEAGQGMDFGAQLVSIVPKNPFESLSEGNMLQVVFFALMLGFALTRLPDVRARPVMEFFDTLSDAIVAMVHLIMKIAPLGVFALMATVVASLAGMGDDLSGLRELAAEMGKYMAAVVVGLFCHAALVYLPLLRFVAKVPLGRFFRAIAPAQLLAFSSSSSGATLPVTMECVERGLGVDEEATSFVLPLGATINMDGTGLYQGVAAVFIATMYNMDLSVGQQLEIVLVAALASIGTAAVPGVGIVMLTIV